MAVIYIIYKWAHSSSCLSLAQTIVIRTDQISRSVVSDSLPPHELKHTRPPCPSPTPGVHSDSTSIESVMPSSHLILCHPLLLLPLIPPSIRIFSNESTLHITTAFMLTSEHPGLEIKIVYYCTLYSTI